MGAHSFWPYSPIASAMVILACPRWPCKPGAFAYTAAEEGARSYSPIVLLRQDNGDVFL
jgi:hypothetical protein